jgi:prostaglandin-endoperoxide synthase 2
MRDTSRDGLKNQIEDFVTTHFYPLWWIIMKIPPVCERVNRFLIDYACKYIEARPRPFSSRTIKGDETPPSDDGNHPPIATYTSWDSLMDQRWFSRYLPVKEMADLPPVAQVMTLFKVDNDGPKLSDRSTLLFPVFAQWFTDGFLMTEPDNPRRTFCCHQIDFNPLYGLDVKQTNALRLQSEKPSEKGLLKFETIDGEVYAPKLYDELGEVKKEFKDLRPPLKFDQYLAKVSTDVAKKLKQSIFAFGGERANSTPYTAMLNTLFLREHNRIASRLEKENPEWDDERIFQTGRNINMVLLIKIVVEEYVNHISPLYFQLKADPTPAWTAPWNKTNWMCVEFNLLYRWHSLCPDRFEIDGQTHRAEKVIFNNAPLLNSGVSGLMRAASRQRAWRLGLFNTAKFLQPVEETSIRLGRRNKLASYNDYREAFQFPRVTRFEQISDDPRVVEALRQLYDDIDKVEYFVGVLAEPIMPRGALPPLLRRIVALDAFTFALTNPLLSEHVFNERTFTKSGMEIIQSTSRLQDVLNRNVPLDKRANDITMNYGEAK